MRPNPLSWPLVAIVLLALVCWTSAASGTQVTDESTLRDCLNIDGAVCEVTVAAITFGATFSPAGVATVIGKSVGTRLICTSAVPFLFTTHNLTLINLQIEDCRSTDTGAPTSAGITIKGAAANPILPWLNLDTVTFQNLETVTQGAAVYSEYAVLNATNALFYNCHTTGTNVASGGAVSMVEGQAIFDGSTFDGCSAPYSGAALRMTATTNNPDTDLWFYGHNYIRNCYLTGFFGGVDDNRVEAMILVRAAGGFDINSVLATLEFSNNTNALIGAGPIAGVPSPAQISLKMGTVVISSHVAPSALPGLIRAHSNANNDLDVRVTIESTTTINFVNLSVIITTGMGSSYVRASFGGSLYCTPSTAVVPFSFSDISSGLASALVFVFANEITIDGQPNSGQRAIYVGNRVTATLQAILGDFKMTNMITTQNGDSVVTMAKAGLLIQGRSVRFEFNQGRAGLFLIGDSCSFNVTADQDIVWSHNEGYSSLQGTSITARALSTARSSIFLTALDGEISFVDNTNDPDSGFGGAVYLEQTDFQYYSPRRMRFERNSAYCGGALAIASGASGNFSSMSFLHNTAESDGCAVYYTNITCPFAGSDFGSSLFTGNINVQNESNPDCPIHKVCDLAVPEPPVACSSSPPTPTAICDTGVWTLDSSEITPATVISSPVVIIGNTSLPSVTITNVFSGPTGQAIITSPNCVVIDGVVVQLSQEDLALLRSGSRTVNLISSSCPTNAVVSLSGSKPTKSCQRVNVKPNSPSPTLQSAVFSIDSSRCNVWWIVLVSVLGFVVLCVIVFVLLATYNKKVKAAIRPFWARGHRDS